MGAEAANVLTEERPRSHAGLIFGGAAVLALALALLPTSFWSDQLQLVAIDRSIRPLGDRYISWIRMAIAGAALSLFGLALLAQRQRAVAAWGSALQHGVTSSWRQLRTELASLFLADSRMHAVTLALICVIGTVARLAFLWQPMGYDESITYVYFASRGVLDILSDYTIPNNHVLHSLLVHASTALFGNSPPVVRLPAFIAGLLCIPAAYALARRIFNDTSVALLTAGFVAAAPAAVEFSAQARGYTAVTFFLLLALIAATYLRHATSRGAWTVFVIAMVLGFFTIPTMLLGYVIVSAWLFLASDATQRRRLFREWLLASAAIGVVVALLYAPIIVRSGLGSLIGSRYTAPLRLFGFLSLNRQSLHQLALCWTGALPVPFVILAVVAVGAGLIAPGAHARRLALAVLSVVPVIVLQRTAPPHRTLSLLFPLAAMIASYGLVYIIDASTGRLLSRRIGAAAALALLVAGLWTGARIARGTYADPDAPQTVWTANASHSANCCAEGFFRDADTIVHSLDAALRQGETIVAHTHSGIVISLQYYLLQRGHSPVQAYPFEPKLGVRQLRGQPVFVVIDRVPADSMKRRTDIAAVLGVPADELALAYGTPELAGQFAASDVYRVIPHDPAQRRRLPIVYPF